MTWESIGDKATCFDLTGAAWPLFFLRGPRPGRDLVALDLVALDQAAICRLIVINGGGPRWADISFIDQIDHKPRFCVHFKGR